MIALVLVLLRATWSVTLNPTSSYVKPGMDIVVVCRTKLNKPPKWEFNGRVLGATSGYKIENTKDSSLLFITGIKDSMMGTYVCHDSVSSAKFHLYDIDTIIRFKGCESRNGIVGDPVMIIPCRVVVSHNITKVVVLTKDGNLIVNGEKFHVSQNRIIIHKLSYKDQGNYVLHVFTKHEISTEKTIKVSIFGPPQVIFDPANLAVRRLGEIACFALSSSDLSVSISGLDILSCTQNLSCVNYLHFGNNCTLRAVCRPPIVFSSKVWCNATNSHGQTNRDTLLRSLIVPKKPHLDLLNNGTIVCWADSDSYSNDKAKENYVSQFIVRIDYVHFKRISFSFTLPGTNRSIDLRNYVFLNNYVDVGLIACNRGVCSDRRHIMFHYKRDPRCKFIRKTCYCGGRIVLDSSYCLWSPPGL